MKKVAFLDRDGVINKEVNYLHRIEDFEYTPNCIEGLLALKEQGYEFVVVTNQAGIAHGYYTESDYQRLTDWYVTDLKRQGIELLEVLHCPHHPNGKVEQYKKVCECRKPAPGMITTALVRHEIDASKSIMVGDKESDVEASRAAGLQNAFLVSTGHQILHSTANQRITYCDLLAIAKKLKCARESNYLGRDTNNE